MSEHDTRAQAEQRLIAMLDDFEQRYGPVVHQDRPTLPEPPSTALVERLDAIFQYRATAQGISTGDYVAWNTSGGKAKGRVVSIHTDSTVPNAPTKVQGTADDPAARIQVHEPHPDGGYVPTDQHVAHKVSALTKIDPLPAPPAKHGAPMIPMPMIGHGGTVTLSAPTPEQRAAHETDLRAWLGNQGST